MRRLLALAPALALVLALAPSARASDPAKQADCHVHGDPSTTGVTATISGDDSGTTGYNNQPILLLHRVTVTNTCNGWAVLETYQHDTQTGLSQKIHVLIAPLTTRTIGRPGLEKIGLWQHPYTNWSIKAPYWATTPCAGGPTVAWVLANGHLTTTQPPC